MARQDRVRPYGFGVWYRLRPRCSCLPLHRCCVRPSVAAKLRRTCPRSSR
jgi:hypothetical protein